MLEKLFGFVIKAKENNVDSSPDNNSSYSSQTIMLKALHREDEPGLCSPLTNLFVKSQIHKDPADLFEKSNKKVYIDARIEDQHQEILRQEGKDGLHSAFVDTNTPFEVSSLSVTSTFNLNVNQVLPGKGHAIITYPCESYPGNNDPYHQVYLGKLEEDTCMSFDASIPEGKKLGNCQDLLNSFIHDISTSKDIYRPEKLVTIATSSFFTHKKPEPVEKHSCGLQRCAPGPMALT